MNRPRKKNRHLPPCVYFKHGAYYYVKAGKWERIGATLPEALSEYGGRIEKPRGEMPALIDRVFAEHEKTLAPSTRRQYRLAADRLKHHFEQFSPRQVKSRHVAALKLKMREKPNMANRILSFLRTVFAYALEWQLVDDNPCIGVRRHKEGKRKRYITDAEFRAIYAQAGARLQVIMDLQYLTGQRINDVLTLRRSAIQDDGILLKPKKVENSTGATMLLRWTPDLREVVERAKALNPRFSTLTLLHGRTGKAPNYRTVALQWTKAAAAAGIEDARPNDPRAKSATDAKRQGKNPRALLGHSSDAMTERYLRQHETPEVDGPSFGQLIDSGQKRKQKQ